MKSAVELNSFLLKLFSYVTWFDQSRNREIWKGGSTADNSIRFIVKGRLTRNDLYDTICMTLILSATLSGVETLKHLPFHGICCFVEIFSFFSLVSEFFSK